MPAIDHFSHFGASLTAPATRIEAISPNDTVDLDVVTRALNVSSAGTVAFVTEAGETGDVYIAAGVTFPIRVRRVLNTGTTAGGIRGLS